MQVNLLQARTHRATVTRVELDHEGYRARDEPLLEVAGFFEYEQTHVYNIADDERFVTHAIGAECGPGANSVKGAVAHKTRAGDLVIIAAFSPMNQPEAAGHGPRRVCPGADNRMEYAADCIPAQAA